MGLSGTGVKVGCEGGFSDDWMQYVGGVMIGRLFAFSFFFSGTALLFLGEEFVSTSRARRAEDSGIGIIANSIPP